MKAVCVGHSTYDTTLPMDFYPEENLKYRITKNIECGGGPACNGGYVMAKWGMDTAIVSIVGEDYYGSQIIKEFQNVKADTTYIEARPNYTTPSSYIIANMTKGTRTIITAQEETYRKLNMDISNIQADYILIDGEHPETAKELLLNNPKAISVLDAGRLTPDRKELGKMVTYVICSKVFAEEFAGAKIDINNHNSLIYCYEVLHSFYNTNIIITLEDKGSFTKIDNDYMIIPSVKVKALDSTGAGDIFHGAFLYFIAHNYSLLDAIKYSSITSAISVTRIGSRLSIPELTEVLNYDKPL
jgi:sulfofructose kinase